MRKNGEVVPCSQCGTEVYKKRVRLLRSKGIGFCSHPCSVLFWKGRPRTLTDQERKRRIENLGSRMLDKRQPISKRLGMMGANNPSWKGGVTKLIHALRGTEEYKRWRMNCMIRDKFHCTECGCSRKDCSRLEVHHIESFSRLLRRLGISSLQEGINCPELWSLSNGKTICPICHSNTDSFASNLKEYTILRLQRTEKRTEQARSLTDTLSRYLRM